MKGLARRVGGKGSAYMQRRVRSCGLALQHEDRGTQGLFILKDGRGTVASMVRCKRDSARRIRGGTILESSVGWDWLFFLWFQNFSCTPRALGCAIFCVPTGLQTPHFASGTVPTAHPEQLLL